ncbi:hypothetical protein BVG19_g658 [[Candida] boidinii]|nr:hypothetical protein BVG19_g658 [[Candida] boidinii]OWB51889.1 hypothetical protein B5S27_g3459 [[Candida] boidinii]OWB85696.1 hypothetical protein B5S33_g4367 [[Candida] boidinii]
MEKFSDWRDKATGISPFMPIPKPKGSIVINNIIKPITFIIKLPILIILSIFFIFFNNILTIKPIRDFFLFNLILKFIFNIKDIEVIVEGVKKSNLKLINDKKPEINDICILNYSSPFDAVAFSLISKSNKIVYLLSDKNGNLMKFNSLFNFFKFTAFNQNINDEDSTICDGGILKDVSELRGKTACVFFEGTPSNNKSILYPNKNLFDIKRFKSTATTDGSPFTLKLVSITCSPYLTTPLPRSVGKYLYDQMVEGSSCGYKMKIFEETSLDISKLTWLQVREKLSQSGRLKLVGSELGIESKKKFFDAFKKGKKIN